MNLQDIFEQLTSGELSQLSLGGGELGFVPESAYPALTTNVQLGLTALYKRFSLKEARKYIALEATTTTYPVAATDLLKIERVLTDAGAEFPLNNSADGNSCFTPSALVLEVPAHVAKQGSELDESLKTTGLTLVYRANHPKLAMSSVISAGPASVELELPDSHTQALLLFVAARVHAPQGMAGNFNPGNNFFSMYEAECTRLTTENLQVDKSGQESRIRRGGWV